MCLCVCVCVCVVCVCVCVCICVCLQISVGLLGIITEVTLSIENSYLLREVLARRTLTDCLSQFDQLMRGGDHAKMWVEPFSEACVVFTANKTSETTPRDNPSFTLKNIEVFRVK